MLAFLLAMGLLLRHVARPRPRLEPRNWWPLMRAAAPIGLAGVAGVVLFRVDTVMLAAFKPQRRGRQLRRRLPSVRVDALPQLGGGRRRISRSTRAAREQALAGVYERSLKLRLALVLPFAVGAARARDQVVARCSTATTSNRRAGTATALAGDRVLRRSYLAGYLLVSQERPRRADRRLRRGGRRERARQPRADPCVVAERRRGRDVDLGGCSQRSRSAAPRAKGGRRSRSPARASPGRPWPRAPPRP